jgi:putative membrane protein
MNDRDTGWIVILAIILIVVLIGPFMFMGGMMGPGMMGGGMMGGGMMGYGYGFNWFGAIIQLLFFLIFIGLIIFGVYYFVSGSTLKTGARSLDAPKSSDRSLEILKERYAKGEITKEEYDRIKKELS